MSILENIFGKKDWVPVWTELAYWDEIDVQYFSKIRNAKSCSYTIYHSESRKKYKLEMDGFRPRQHPKFRDAIDKLSVLVSYYDYQEWQQGNS